MELITPGGQEAFIPISAPFDADWMFWMIVGKGIYENKTLFISNSLAMNDKTYKNEEMLSWIEMLANSKNNSDIVTKTKF